MRKTCVTRKVVRVSDWVVKSVRSRYFDVSFGNEFSFLAVNKAKHNWNQKNKISNDGYYKGGKKITEKIFLVLKFL